MNLKIMKAVIMGLCEAIIIIIILILPLPGMLKILLITASGGGVILGAVQGGIIAISAVTAKTVVSAGAALMLLSPAAYGGAWAMGLTSICGDGRCDITECATGCGADCDAATCSDGICQAGIGENCQNSNDCTCQNGDTCNPTRDEADVMGCVMTSCGDGHCDPSETQSNCCSDCGCPTGYSCQNNQCTLESLEMTVTGFQTSADYSATTLYTNPTLHYPVLSSGTGHSLMTVTIQNNGQTKASGVQVGVKAGDYTDWSYKSAGQMLPSASGILDFNPVFTYNVMGVSEDETVQVQIKITYSDVQGTEHTNYFSESMKIISREWMDWDYPGLIAGWITANDPLVRSATTASTGGLAPAYVDDDIYPAAERVWSYFNGSYPGTPYTDAISYVSDPRGIEFVQFPAQTLRNNAGDCEDLAVLFASALESVGIQTFIILIPGHAFMAFCDSVACDYVYPVETTLFDSASLEEAINVANAEWDAHSGSDLWIIDTTSPYISPPSQM